MRATSLFLPAVGMGLMLASIGSLAASVSEVPSRPREREIVLGADFIERHATNRNGTRLQIGVAFSNGYVAEAVSFKNVDLPFELTFEHCDFLKAVDFSFARFQRRVALRGCVFTEHVSLEGIQVEKDLDLTGSVFLKGISLEKAHIQGRLLARGVVMDGPAKFAECKIDLTADFGMELMSTLGLEAGKTSSNDVVRAVLTSQGQTPTAGMEVASFVLPGESSSSPLPEYLWIIRNKCSQPFFYAVWQKCYQSTNYTLEVFKQTAFLDPVEMIGVHCGSKLLLGSVNFRDRARFDGIKVDGSVYLAGAQFYYYCSFGYAQITEDFDATEVQFSGSCDANFHGMRARRISLDRATFGSRADFGDATANLSFEAGHARFTSCSNFINFQGLKTGGAASFKEAHFEGPVSFALANIGGNFDAESAQFRCSAPSNELAKIAAPDPLHFHADFGSMRVDGVAILSRASFSGVVSLRNASFQQLHLDLPANRTDLFTSCRSNSFLLLEGCAFKRIRAVTNESFQNYSEQLNQSWLRLRDVLREYAPYSPNFYQNVEDSFKREGQTELADEVYVESRRRERKELSGLGWLWNFFLDATMRFGRNPWWAVLYSMVIMAGGALVFKPEYMVETGSDHAANGDKASTKYHYSQLMYSIDLFLPVLPLNDADQWEPRKDCPKWIWLYQRLHTFIGWVLTPVALAALSGFVKLTEAA